MYHVLRGTVWSCIVCEMETEERRTNSEVTSEITAEDLPEERETDGSEEDGKKLGRKIAMGLVALIASASVALAGFFSEPAALLDREIKIPSPQVDVLVDDDDDEGDENEENEKNEGFSEKTKAMILRIPIAVRGTVGIVMWTLGWVLIKLATLLWVGVLSPLLGFLLHVLLTFAILAAVVAGVLKLLFPWLRLRDIFNKKNIIFLLIVSVLLNLCDLILPLVWKDYTRIRDTVLFILYFALSVVIIIAAVSKIRKLKTALTVLAG